MFLLEFWTNLTLIKFFVFRVCIVARASFLLCVNVQMSPFKSLTMKGGSKGKEPVIDVDDSWPRSKRTRFSSEVNDLDLFRSYVAFQNNTTHFRNAPLLVERSVDQSSLLDTNIPIWFATKDWNFLLSNLKDAYENLVKEFYANAIVEGEEIKC